jgi:outer membrane protein OmpA-like peptidoglycan-associated protein
MIVCASGRASDFGFGRDGSGQRPAGGAVRSLGLLSCVVALLAVLSGCQDSSTGESAPRLVIVVSGTSNEPQPALSRQGRDTVHAAANDGGSVTVIRTGGRADLVTDRDLTVRRPSGDPENDTPARDRGAAQRADEVSSLVQGITANAPGNNLLAGLDAAGAVRGPATVLVLGSGLQTVDPLDLRRLGWSVDPRATARDLAARRLLPALSGKQVIFTGLGQVAGAQPDLPPPARETLRALWCAIVTTAGGTCQTDDEPRKVAPPRATLPVPVVGPPSVFTRQLGPKKQYVIPSSLLFSADSALLERYADAVLTPIARSLRQGCVVDITGHTASWGPVSGRYALSRARARAVANRLLALGAPRSAVDDVRGVGSDHGVPDLDASGRLIPAAAERNRVVELVLHGTTCRTEGTR